MNTIQNYREKERERERWEMLCKSRATAPHFLIRPQSSPWESVHLWGSARSSSHLRSAKRASHTWPRDNVIYGDPTNKNRFSVYAHVGFPVLSWWYVVLFGGLVVSRSHLRPPDVLNQGARFWCFPEREEQKHSSRAWSKPFTCW